MRRMTGPAIVLSATTFAAAVVIFGSTLLEAVRVEDGSMLTDASAVASAVAPGESPTGQSPPPASSSASVPPPPGRFSEAAAPVVTLDEILGAVEGDPFLPNRRAPAQRYQLPGEIRTEISEGELEPVPAPALRVVGTAVIGRGGIALVQFEENPVVAVSMGDYVEGYRLAAIGPERATLVGAAGRLILPVMEPLRASERRTRGRDDRANAEREAQTLARMQELLRAQRGLTFGRGDGRAGFGGGRGNRGGRGGGGADGGPDGPPPASP